MKKALATCVMLVMVFSLLTLSNTPVPAEENVSVDGKNHVVADIELDFYSRYICGTSGGTAYNRPVVQGSTRFSLEPIGAYIKFWGSGALTQDGGNKCGNEYDLIVGIVRPIWKFKVDMAYGYFDLHPQFRGRGDLHALYETVSLPGYFIEPYVSVECDIPTDKKTLEGGWYYRAGITKSFELRKNLALTGDLSIGGNDGPFGFRPDFVSFARGGLSLCWSPYKNFSVTPQIYYQKRLGHHPSDGGIARNAFWGGISFNYHFDLFSF